MLEGLRKSCIPIMISASIYNTSLASENFKDKYSNTNLNTYQEEHNFKDTFLKNSQFKKL